MRSLLIFVVLYFSSIIILHTSFLGSCFAAKILDDDDSVEGKRKRAERLMKAKERGQNPKKSKKKKSKSGKSRKQQREDEAHMVPMEQAEEIDDDSNPMKGLPKPVIDFRAGVLYNHDLRKLRRRL